MGRRGRLLTKLIIILLTIFSFNLVNAQQTVIITIYRSENSLTVYFPGGQMLNVSELRLEVNRGGASNEVWRLQEFSAFRGMRFDNLPTPLCFHIARVNTYEPLPFACPEQFTLRQDIAVGDVFWYNSIIKTDRTLFIYLGNMLRFCGSGANECELSFEQPIPTPTSTPTDIPTATPTSFVVFPTDTPTLTATSTDTPTVTPSYTYTPIPTSTYPARVGYINPVNPTERVNLRRLPNTNSTVIDSLSQNTEVTILNQEAGEIVAGTSIWYWVQTRNLQLGYIHSSLISLSRIPSIPQPQPGVTLTTGSDSPPPPTSGCPGRIRGTAADLFSVSGRRRVEVYVPANRTIEVTLYITNQVDPWGARVVLENTSRQELAALETHQSPNRLITSIRYTTSVAGTYLLGLNGDSTHHYNYEVAWTC